MNRHAAINFCIKCVMTISLSNVVTSNASAEDTFWNALSGGKFDFSAHWRFEHVDDDLAPGGVPLKEANASTIRTTLGYKTGSFHHFDARLLVQDVRTAGMDDFNDGTGRPNAKTQYAVIVDPSDTDYIEGYIGFSGIPDTSIKAGRQFITYRDAPFHRYMGTILWRQNWQNHDAVTLQNTSLPDTILNYAYSWNINRIFTDEARGALANFDSDSHFINVKYNGFSPGGFEGYAYLLDFENAPAFSTNTYGIRFNGGYPVTEKVKALYTAEYAYQTDTANNNADFDGSYYLGELGVNFKTGSNIINAITVKFSYEKLEGEGDKNGDGLATINSFNTILGTNHAFQGWADRFLITPENGIVDYYVTAVVNILGTNFVASYHDLNSDRLGYDYGNELNLMLTKTFMEHYTIGLKYADYNADSNPNNVGATAADVSKFWAWVQVKF